MDCLPSFYFFSLSLLAFFFFFLMEGIRPSWHKVTFPNVIPARRQNCCLDRSQSPLLPLQLRTQPQAPARRNGGERRRKEARKEEGRMESRHLPAHLSLQQSSPPTDPRRSSCQYLSLNKGSARTQEKSLARFSEERFCIRSA